jgi:hypothetical protein
MYVVYCTIFSRVGVIGFIAPYTFTQLGTTGNTAPLSSSPLHTH